MNNITTYAGIGSRQIGEYSYQQCVKYGKILGELGLILRSGGARGSDEAFEAGSDSGNGKKEIYLPYKGSNGNTSELYHIPNKAYEIAKQFHPAWRKLTEMGQLLMARNSQIILGANLRTPVDFTVCWTENGEDIGGTAQGIRISRYFNIPIFNLGIENDYEKLDNFINSIKLLHNI